MSTRTKELVNHFIEIFKSTETDYEEEIKSVKAQIFIEADLLKHHSTDSTTNNTCLANLEVWIEYLKWLLENQ